MTHQRQTIRQSIAAQLVGATDAGTRVYPWRIDNWAAEDLPGIAIYCRMETIVVTSIHKPKSLQRTADIVVEAIASGSQLDNTLDTLAEQIEIALASDPTLGQQAQDLVLQRTDIDIDGSGEATVGRISLNYLVQYYTLDTTPNTLA